MTTTLELVEEHKALPHELKAGSDGWTLYRVGCSCGQRNYWQRALSLAILEQFRHEDAERRFRAQRRAIS